MSSLTVSLNELKKAGACRERYAHLVEKLGGVSFDHDARINLLTVMEHNGLKDTLWALRRIPTKRGKIICILFAADCAERVLPLFEQRFPNDDRPRKAIAAARNYAYAADADAAADAAAAARAQMRARCCESVRKYLPTLP